jgi:hypothetical protein
MIIKEILPLAIADVDDIYACVAGISLEYEWLRPESIYQSDLIGDTEIDFDHITKFALESNQAGRRLEDRELGKKRYFKKGREMDSIEKEKIFQKIGDPSVDDVFLNGKTAGLFRVNVKDIQFGRTFGAGRKIRIIFEDQTGKEFNLIVVDKKFKEWFLDYFISDVKIIIPSKKELLIEELKGDHSYFAITLSDNKGNFPSTYNGCHALISGVHILDRNIYEKNIKKRKEVNHD